jgi:hypothetical protein
MKKSYPSQCIFLLKVLLFALFHMGAVGNSWAQMDHSSHSGLSSSKKPKNSCIGNGLECANAATPFLTKDGKLLLTWTAGGVVSFAQSSDLGKTFNSAVKIAEHGKSLDAGSDARPQIVADSSGNIFLAYAFFKDSKWNAQINTTRSTDNGITFFTPKSLVENGSSERFPSVLMRPDGNIFISWIDKRLVAASNKSGQKKLGGSIAYSNSFDGGKTFQTERIANEDSCECCRIGVSLNQKNQPIIIYRAIFPGGVRDHASQIILSNGPDKIRRIANDEWKTDACPHHGPAIGVSSQGTIHTAWFTQGTNRAGVFYANSHNEGASYSAPMRLGKLDASTSRPYLLALEKNVWLVWKEFDGHDTLVVMKQSGDDGKTWSKETILSKTTDYSDHPLLISQDNQVFLSWLTRAQGYQLIKIGQVE